MIFVILTIQGLWIIDKGIRPAIVEIANLETQKIGTAAINNAVLGTLDTIDMDQLIDIKYDEDGNVTSVGFDANVYNKVVTESVSNAAEYLRMMERGDEGGREGIIYHIPLGQVTNNTFLAHLGPKIPVKLTAIGDVDVELREDIRPFGINNTWVRVAMDLEVYAQIIIPFATYTDTVITTVPVGMVFVPGEVPQFYGGGQGMTPTPAVIVDEE